MSFRVFSFTYPYGEFIHPFIFSLCMFILCDVILQRDFNYHPYSDDFPKYLSLHLSFLPISIQQVLVVLMIFFGILKFLFPEHLSLKASEHSADFSPQTPLSCIFCLSSSSSSSCTQGAECRTLMDTGPRQAGLLSTTSAPPPSRLCSTSQRHFVPKAVVSSAWSVSTHPVCSTWTRCSNCLPRPSVLVTVTHSSTSFLKPVRPPSPAARATHPIALLVTERRLCLRTSVLQGQEA